MKRPVEETDARRGVFAYLNVPNITECIVKDTYYPIAGNFTNDPVGGFKIYEDSIQYIGDRMCYFSIVWFATVQSSNSNNTLLFAIKHNGEVLSKSIMGDFLMRKDSESTSGTVVIPLYAKDMIQLVVSYAKKKTDLTFHYFTTSIRPFF